MSILKRIIFCILAAIVITSVFAVIFISSEKITDVTLSVTATGKNSPSSWGKEVRIVSITIDGKSIDLPALASASEGWKMEGDLLTAMNVTKPVSVVIPDLGDPETFSIKLIGQMGSGYLDIAVNDRVETIDLYRDSSWEEFCWNFENKDGFRPSEHIFELFVVAAAAFMGLMWLTGIPRMKKGIFVLSLVCIVITGLWLVLEFLEVHASEPDLTKGVCQVLFDRRTVPYWLSMLAFALLLPILSKKRKGFTLPALENPVRILLWAALILMGSEFMSCSGTIANLEQGSLILGFILHVSLLLFVYGVTGSIFTSGCIVTTVLLLLNAANYYTIRFRGMALCPSDINAIGTAMEVVGGYDFNFEKDMLVTWVFALMALAILWPTTGRKKRRLIPRILPRIACICAGVAVVLAVNNADVQKKFDININYWRIKDQYTTEGLALTFVDNFGGMFVQKPEGYSEKAISALSEKYTADSVSEDSARPTVIVVMNEAFADLEQFEGLVTSEPIMPRINALKNRNNTIYGSAQVSILGGMTSKSEFEFLTGVNGRYCTTGAPYNTIVNDDIMALPRVMGELGYTSIAFHPEYSRNWNRNIAYPYMGFADFIAKDRTKNRKTLRGFISDESFYKEIIEMDAATEEPLFIFGITMQNHSGYLAEDFDEPISIISPEGDFPQAKQYLNLIHESDKAFGKFISHYENSDEPVVILFFGDHFPFVDSGFMNMLTDPYKTGTAKDTLLQYHTPFIIWANYDLDKEKLPEDGSMISLSLLQSVLMDAAGLPKTGFQKFMSDVAASYPVISAGCILDSDGNIVTDENNALLTDYTSLQYDLLKGRTGFYSYK